MSAHAWRARPRAYAPLLLLIAAVGAAACDRPPTEPAVESDPVPTDVPAAALTGQRIHACHDAGGGTLYRIGAAGAPERCRSKDHVEIAWPADGLPGAGGGAGPTGPAGPACWDADRSGGGDPAEDVNGDGHYDVLDCRGAPGTFTGFLTSPDGSFTLGLTDEGIRIETPAAVVVLDAAGVLLQASGSVTVDARSVALASTLGMSLAAGGPLGIETTGLLALQGSLVGLNAATGCSPLARAGDPHTALYIPTTPPAFIPGVIAAGSPTVLSC